MSITVYQLRDRGVAYSAKANRDVNPVVTDCTVRSQPTTHQKSKVISHISHASLFFCQRNVIKKKKATALSKWTQHLIPFKSNKWKYFFLNIKTKRSLYISIIILQPDIVHITHTEPVSKGQGGSDPKVRSCVSFCGTLQILAFCPSGFHFFAVSTLGLL